MAQPVRSPVYFDQEYDEEEEEPNSSGHVCASCQESVNFGDEISLFQGAIPHHNIEKVVYISLLDDEGEPEVMPLVMHGDCCRMTFDALYELVEDQVPIEEPGTVIACDICNCTIRMGEKLVVMDLGKIVQSPRTGSPKISFDEYENHKIMCLTCACSMADITETETWADLSQNGECYHCTKAHCWRAGRCECECHVP